MKKNLLLLTWHGGAGGVSKLVYEISRKLKGNQDFNVTVGYAHEGGIFCNKVREEGITTKIFGMKNGFDLAGALRIKSFINRNKFDIVHLQYITPLLKIAVSFTGSKIIITEHRGMRSYKEKLLWPIFWMVSVLTKNVARIYTTVSKHSLNELADSRFVDKEKIQVIPNGVDVEVFSKGKVPSVLEEYRSGKKEYFIGVVKALTLEHGIDHFILMAHQLNRLRSDVKFFLIGDGPERDFLVNLSKKGKAQDNIYFLGERSDIPEILSGLDVVVLPSRNETFGIVAIEAMAMEKCVVAYAVGGIPEVIDDGVSGILVHERDPRLLAKAIDGLIKDEEKMAKMASSARKKVEDKFNINGVMQQYIELYKKI